MCSALLYAKMHKKVYDKMLNTAALIIQGLYKFANSRKSDFNPMPKVASIAYVPYASNQLCTAEHHQYNDCNGISFTAGIYEGN